MPRKNFTPPRIVVLGDVNIDLIALAHSWPRPGEECLSDRLELHTGGVGANCALALRRWGVAPQLVACVGRDPLADTVLAALAANGIAIRHVQRTQKAGTGLLYIHVTPGGQRTFFGSRGANRLLQPQPAQATLLRSADAACLMGYSFLDPSPEKAAMQLLRAVHANGGWVALDVGMEPSQKIPRKILRILSHIDLLFVSHEEAAALTGRRAPEKAFRTLQAAGAREIVMKLGKCGCLISHAGAIQRVPPFKVRAIDSTGAGDAFTAAFVQARLRHWPSPHAALLANAAGAVATGFVGGGDAAPSATQVAKLLLKHRLEGTWEAVRLNVARRLSRCV